MSDESDLFEDILSFFEKVMKNIKNDGIIWKNKLNFADASSKFERRLEYG